MTTLQDIAISCGASQSSTLDVASVKKKGVHSASTNYPPCSGEPLGEGSASAWYSLVAMANFRVILAVAAVISISSIGLARTAGAQQTPSPLQPAPDRVLTLDECIAIALEAQPRIQATLADYAAARYRVNQSLAPLLPQLSGLVSASRSESTSVTTIEA